MFQFKCDNQLITVVDYKIFYYCRRNLLKTSSMEVGQVSYHDKTKVKRMRVEKDNAIVNNLNRTKEVTHVQFCEVAIFKVHLKCVNFLL